ncbi:MAG: RNA-binding S4 domain-containing protein [Lachnospiraceae bacterium]|nr:RNA-binding S4 domain-containing protein [Lachnospiraceae bacterium]MBQ6026094.1 RNA-binding S4 domain-containing protein [Lachnospiraceae bacterium]MBR3483083.1 RNA-binding S4 domain-containing protein [Lachnospiraceae bacterium]MBR3581419.1 RNA-binding S4 domain-containing protein [Lachnospiraceae bacterium]MBR4541496.1 RNA-binding S4 domain-containing protein [Lachnospiraceae bacterium]
MKKSITIKDEFIKLGQALKLSGEADTGVDAKFIIEDGKVKVNGETELRRGRKLYNGDTFTVNNDEITVISKAGLN